MTDVSRRNLLKGAGLVGAATALPVSARAQQEPHQHPAAPATKPEGEAPAKRPYAFFNSVEAAWVEAAVDRLIPPDPDWPGALAAGVPVYIDGQLAGPYGRGDTLYLAGPWKPGSPEQGYQLRLTPAELYRTSLDAIMRVGPDGKDFAQRSAEDQDGFLKRLEAGEFELSGYSSAVFFETLLANTVEGFFSDPAYGGNQNMVGWRMVGFPGAYAAYVQLYTHHGMKFDREPISMYEHSGHGHGAAVMQSVKE